MTSRRCPTCKAQLPIGTGVFFDSNHNVCCVSCKKIVVAASVATEITETRTHTYPPHPAHRHAMMGFLD